MTEKSPWETLSRIDVTDKIEKKNGLSYLSWAWAWGVLKEHYPHAWFRKHEGQSGYPYFMDVQGYAFVRVTVGLDRTGDHEVTESLPVLDHRNKPIQGPNAFEVNNALQRCLAKAIAYHGLGHYIYAGEDLPMESAGEAVEAPKQKAAPAPAQAAQSAPAAAPSASGGVPLVGPDGSITSHSTETVAAVFTSFIPHCMDERSLTKLYTMNKTAVAYLQSTNIELHKQVMDAFAKRKAELKSAPKKEGVE
jgi:hypothetical protein